MDPLIRLATYEGVLTFSDERSKLAEVLLNVNTQGLKHHIYMLALACLIVLDWNDSAGWQKWEIL